MFFQNMDKRNSENIIKKAQYDDISASIQPYDEIASSEIAALRDSLLRRWQDFTAENRKINIAIIGRGKAGKTTLNTFIFCGHHVLSEAFTPKTATLTKIEYAGQNSLGFEYYSSSE